MYALYNIFFQKLTPVPFQKVMAQTQFAGEGKSLQL
jgi:hypothetical protein